MTRNRSFVLAAACALAASIPCVYGASLVVNEIHYEPIDKTVPEEFIELYNPGAAPVDCSGWYFSEGITYEFPEGTVVASGGYLVVAEDPQTLAAIHGTAFTALGPYAGHLDNGGEEIVLRDALGRIVDAVDYDVGFPWPIASAGDGSSLELINPALDNDLGGSWRASGIAATGNPTRTYLVYANDALWRYRKGTSEPPADWRSASFAEDGSWQTGQTSIGYGDNDDKTPLADMLNGYSSVYLRRAFTIASAEEMPARLTLGVYVDDGAVVWINEHEVGRVSVPSGTLAYNSFGINHEAVWGETALENPASFLHVGENTVAVHALNTTLGSSDFSIDVTLFVPADGEVTVPTPTPGRRNSVYGEAVPPQVRQVAHTPLQPRAGEAIVVTAKATDPDGVAEVRLQYQIVAPGQYVPAWLPLPHDVLLADATRPHDPNPAFENPVNWFAATMRDDGAGDDAAAGDGIYTATLPGWGNRTLVRYRITARDAFGSSVRVPYSDDDALNFACFVYDGVPPYTTTALTVHPEGVGYRYGADVMTTLPVYTIITRPDDFWECIAYDGAYQIGKGSEAARDEFNWEGAFVYRGVVYDHMRYRLRQSNDRYGGQGKRSFRMRFNKGSYLQAHDNYGRAYPRRWRTLCTGKMFDNLRVGNFGLTEKMNSDLWNMSGVPAPWVHTFHFRVVRWADEAPAGAQGQYLGDFYGMHLCFEDYDARFMDAHDLADGNLYKLKDGVFDGNQLKRNQGAHAVTDDSDFQNIRANLRPERDNAWLDAHVNYDRWSRYHAVVEGIRHYDFVPADSHSKNRAWYFEPDYAGSPFGRLWTLPWDSDASWGPNWNSGIDYSKDAIFSGAGKEPFKMNYRNVMREFRDLVWTREVVERSIDDLAARLTEFAKADRDRWRSAPYEAGSQDFGTMEAKVQDMKNFAFVGWSGGSGPAVPAGGRAAYLDSLAAAEGESGKIPATPTVTAVGPAGFPADALVFRASEFSDPQGDAFGAIAWRLGAITPSGTAFDPATPRLYECAAVWQNESAAYARDVTVPRTVVTVGGRYRVRARVQDLTGRWSHWSAPAEFTAGAPLASTPQEDALRITELMYHAEGDTELEFTELMNTGVVALDLSAVRFGDGVEFAFAGSAVTTLGPGQYVVVVKDLAVFASAYEADGLPIAGQYKGGLDNAGERVSLLLGETVTIVDFTYDEIWHPATDGGGYSLVVRDPAVTGAALSTAEAWRPSLAARGSPGGPDLEPGYGLQRAGDLNQDGRRDISDAVAYLRYLFAGASPHFPCGAGTLAEASNLALFDLNGSAAVDIADCVYLLAHLFAHGPAPALGAGCVPVADCASTCGR